MDTIKYDREGGAKETGKSSQRGKIAPIDGIILSEFNHLQKICESFSGRRGRFVTGAAAIQANLRPETLPAAPGADAGERKAVQGGRLHRWQPAVCDVILNAAGYSNFRVAVMGEHELKWLFPQRGPCGQVFVRGVEVKATLLDLRYRTLTLKML